MSSRCRSLRPNVLDEVIGSQVGSRVSGVRFLFRPGVVTVLAVVVLFHQPGLGEQAGGDIGQQGVPGKLRIVNLQRLAFRAVDGVAEEAFGEVPREEEFFGTFDLVRGDFEARSGGALGHKPKFLEPEFVLDFRSAARLKEALADGFCKGTGGEEGNRDPVHGSNASRRGHFDYPFFGNDTAVLGLGGRFCI